MGNMFWQILSVSFGLIKMNRVYLLVQVLINLHGYFYVALQLKIQRCGKLGVLLCFVVGVSPVAYTEVRTIRAPGE